MKYELIRAYADEIENILRPYCKQIEIAGSIRRLSSDCKDVEIVCIANKYHLEKYFIENKSQYIFIKNGGKYKQFKFKAVTIDLFIATPENFGLIYMLRTGSAGYNIRLISALKKKSILCVNGRLRKNGAYLITPDEESIFNLLDVSFVPPTKRNVKLAA